MVWNNQSRPMQGSSVQTDKSSGKKVGEGRAVRAVGSVTSIGAVGAVRSVLCILQLLQEMDGSLESRQEGSKKYSGSLQGHLALEGCGKDGGKTLDLGSVPMTNTGWSPPLRAPNISRAPGGQRFSVFPPRHAHSGESREQTPRRPGASWYTITHF